MMTVTIDDQCPQFIRFEPDGDMILVSPEQLQELSKGSVFTSPKSCLTLAQRFEEDQGLEIEHRLPQMPTIMTQPLKVLSDLFLICFLMLPVAIFELSEYRYSLYHSYRSSSKFHLHRELEEEEKARYDSVIECFGLETRSIADEAIEILLRNSSWFVMAVFDTAKQKRLVQHHMRKKKFGRRKDK